MATTEQRIHPLAGCETNIFARWCETKVLGDLSGYQTGQQIWGSVVILWEYLRIEHVSYNSTEMEVFPKRHFGFAPSAT